jgi:hypothetical protein
MSIISNKGKGGNSSAFAGIHQILNGLQASADGLAGLSVILNSILNATVAHQDMEILLVRDTGNADLVVQQIREYDETTQTWSTSYQKVDGSPYVAPELVGPLVYLDPSAVLNLILAEMLDQGVTLDNIDTTTANSLVELLAQGLSLDAIVTSTGLSATEVTLAALLTAFNATGFATEVTLALANSNIVLGNLTLNALLNETGLAPNSAVVEKLNSAAPTNSTFAAANVLRRSLKVTNNSESPIYLKEGAVATSTSFTWIIEEGETVIIDDYNGQVDGTWLGVVTAPGTNALITETTF